MINGDPFFILIALSRYLRFPYFFIVLMRNHEFAETDIDKAITMQLVMIINMAIILAGIFGEMENSHFLIGDAKEVTEKMKLEFSDNFAQLHIHDTFYFVVVTLVTVGYGDINPNFWLSMIWVMLIIFITFIYFPMMCSDMLRLLSLQSKYRRNAYVHSDLRHVVVTGNISIQSIRDFTTELFHEDHGCGSNSTNAVVIQNKDPDKEIQIFLEK